MTANIGAADKIARIILGVFLLSLTVWGPQSLWGLVGIIPLGTALINWCPLYTVFKFTTVPAEKTGK